MLLKLKGDRKGAFKRNARDAAGNIVRRYEWKPGVTLEVHDDDLTLVGDDILNGVLIPMQMNEDRVAVEVDINADRDAFKEALAEAHEEAHQRRLAFQAAKQAEKDAKRKPRTKKAEAPKNDPPKPTGDAKDGKKAKDGQAGG